jgi:hypothetical protein
VNRQNASTIYATTAGFINGQKIFMSSNSGITWQNITYNLPNIPVNCVKNVPGTAMLLAATDIGVYKLDSASTTWVLYSQGLPNVITTDIEFNQANNKIYLSTFGRGIWETDLNTLTGTSQQQSTASNIKIYPTINNGSFTLDLSDIKKEIVSMIVLDALGKKVFEKEVEANQKNNIQLNLSKGLYYIKLQGENYLGSTAIIIQ